MGSVSLENPNAHSDPSFPKRLWAVWTPPGLPCDFLDHFEFNAITVQYFTAPKALGPVLTLCDLQVPHVRWVTRTRWVDKEETWYTYTMEYYSTIKKNEILPLATTWKDLEGIMPSEISQRKTNTVWFHLYVEPKKTKQMNKYNKTDS